MTNKTVILAAALLSSALCACSDMSTRAYNDTPYIRRTAGLGVEYYNAGAPQAVMVEPAAGDVVFQKGVRK